MLLVCLTACRTADNHSSDSEIAAENASKILDALLENDTDVNLLSDSGARIANLSGGDLSASIMEKITYEIKSTEQGTEFTVVRVSFTFPDVVSMVEAFAKEQGNHEFSDWLISTLNGTYPTEEKEIELQLIEKDSGQYLIVTNELYNILSGGAVNYMIAQEKEAYESWLEQKE